VSDEQTGEEDQDGGTDGGADEAERPDEAEDTSSSSSDDDGSSDDESSSESAPATATPTTTAAAKKASAGARLAAAKAAKAAAKAAKKQARRDEAGVSQAMAQREAEDRARTQSAEDVLKESPLGRAATRAGEWTQQNQQLAMGVAAVAVAALIGWVGWTWYSGSQAAAAGALLSDALEISSAEIVAEGATHEAAAHDDGDEDDAPTYESIDARNTAALAAYRRVSSEYPGSDAAAWARLGEGRTLLSQHEYADARTAYQAAFDQSGDESVVAWQALEGIGATYEAESDWEHATSTYERLASLADHAYESVANYHLARMHAASGDESAALTSFRELVDTLRESGSSGEPPFPYVLTQADQRLRELDPSAAGAGPTPHVGAGSDVPPGLDGLTPEQIQELLRRFQQEQGGGSGDAPPE